MTLLAVEGVYSNGTVELREKPAGIENARVVVTFLPDQEGEGRTEQRHKAVEQLIETMHAGIDFAGEKFSRAEIYQEHIGELDRYRNAPDHAPESRETDISDASG